MRTWTARLAVAWILTLAGCAHGLHLRGPAASSIEVVTPADRDYAAADPAGATGKPGEGKIIRPFVVRLTRDVKVYRLWGQTSRIGQWWTFDPPTGSRAGYRARYEVCDRWNTLQFVATCTLKRGAVVVVGAGQSVSANTCGSGTESYAKNERDWQVYIHDARSRADLSCPDEREDYENDPRDISRGSSNF